MSDPEPVRVTAPEGFDPNRRFVRVMGNRNGFVEFEFAVGEPEICVEMVLTPEAFEQFCATNKPEMLPPRSAQTETEQEDRGMDWRLSDATHSASHRD